MEISTQKPLIMTSVKVSYEFYNQCKKYRIKFSDALKVGISILLAERGVIEYDNKLNIIRIYKEIKLKAQDYAIKLAELEEKYEKMYGKSIKNEKTKTLVS